MKVNSVNPVIGQYSKIRSDAVWRRQYQAQAMDEVELSPEARLFTEAFSAARRSLQQSDAEQTVRVNEIMEQMRSGDYRVEIRDICDKLLS